MIDFIVFLEGLFLNSGIEYEIMYDPNVKAYFLKIDGEIIKMEHVMGGQNND